jgi:AcrR family transcriptional regulator
MPTPKPDRADPDRERLRAAVVAVVAERGYRDTTVDAVLQRSGLKRAAFDRYYPDLEACFADVWEDAKAEFLRATGAAFENADTWREGMRAAAWAFCRFVQEDRRRARLFFLEFNFAGEALQASRDVVMREYADLVEGGNQELGSSGTVPREQAEAMVGAIWEGALTTVKAGTFDDLPAVIPQAMYLTVFQYLGAAAAQEELRRGPVDIARYERGEL